MSVIKIRQLGRDDLFYKEARALYHKYLGLNPFYEDPNQIFWAALDQEKVVGASSLVLEIDEDGEIEGLLEGVVVDIKYRGQKIGERLTAARIEYAVSHDAAYLTSLVWCHPDPAASRYILEKFGLEALEYQELAYAEEIPSDRWAFCPKCGTSCVCSGLFMACRVKD